MVEVYETGFKPIYEDRDPELIEADELLRKKLAIKNQIENRYGDKKKKGLKKNYTLSYAND